MNFPYYSGGAYVTSLVYYLFQRTKMCEFVKKPNQIAGNKHGNIGEID